MPSSTGSPARSTIYITVHLYQVPQLVHIPARTVFSDLVTGVLWGLVTAEALPYLEERGA